MLFYDDVLPLDPTEDERALVADLGPDVLDAIDVTLRTQAKPSWRKVARILGDALGANAFPAEDERYVHLHLRRLIALVESGQLEAEGDLRNPRRSEVRLPSETPRSEPRKSTPARVAELRTAVDAGDLAQVTTLIQRGASVLEPDRYGWLPLHWAAGANRVAIVRLFLSLGAPLEARATDQWTALHLACIAGKFQGRRNTRPRRLRGRLRREGRQYAATSRLGLQEVKNGQDSLAGGSQPSCDG